jgi:hypothetical protein
VAAGATDAQWRTATLSSWPTTTLEDWEVRDAGSWASAGGADAADVYCHDAKFNGTVYAVFFFVAVGLCALLRRLLQVNATDAVGRPPKSSGRAKKASTARKGPTLVQNRLPFSVLARAFAFGNCCASVCC